MNPQSNPESSQIRNPKPGKGGWFRTVLYLGVTVFLCLGLMELVLTLAFPIRAEEKLACEQDIPGLKRLVVYETNRFGLRSDTINTLTPPPSTCRILCLGASTIQQSTKNLADTWSEILRGMLAREFSGRGLRVEMGSFGLGGRRALDRLVWLKEGLPIVPPLNPFELEPDIIIFLEGVNDLTLGGGPEDVYEDLEEKLNRKLDAARRGLKGLILDHSQLARRLRLLYHTAYLRWQVSQGEVADWGDSNLETLRATYQGYPFAARPERSVDPLLEFEFALDGILKITGRAGIETVLLGQPVLWKKGMSPAEKATQWMGLRTKTGWARSSGAWLLEEMTRFNRVQAEAAAAHGATYIDLDGKISKGLENYIDHCHFTDVGSARVAQAIFPALSRKVAEMEEAGLFRD